MPTLPRMEVRLAHTAESTAQGSPPQPEEARSRGFRWSIPRVPARISPIPNNVFQWAASPSNRMESSMVSTVLDLSTGATWLTSPSWSARK